MNSKINDLIFCRQFLFTNIPVNCFSTFKNVVLSINNKNWYLYFHPKLNVLYDGNTWNQIILLGYIIDPFNPERTDKEILEMLLGLNSFELIIKETNNFCGRFVIIHSDNKSIKIFNDAVGFRTVYYHIKNNLNACGSTPDIIAYAHKLPLTSNKEIINFYNSEEFKKNDQIWIGKSTMYDNIYHLLPNHFLNFSNNVVKRFWPDFKIFFTANQKDKIKLCAEILQNTLLAASKRYKLHFGITAGWDTRLLFAASGRIKDSTFYYVNKSENFTLDHIDIKIPLLMAEKFGFKLNIIDINSNVNPVFEKIFFKNNILANKKLLPVFHEVYNRNITDSYTVTGVMGNGIARIYMRLPEDMEVNGKNLARFSNYQNLKYPVEALEEWITEVKDLCNENNIDIMDLYQWEQDNAHWATCSAIDQDIVRDEIVPFNNRKLISLFWSMKPSSRYQYNPVIYKKIIRLLWKDALNFPVNPSRKSHLFSILRFLGLEQKIYYYYKKRKFKSI